MRRYLLDSGPLAAYLLGRQTAPALVRPWIRRRAVATSMLVYGEVIEYIMGMAGAQRRRTELRRLLRTVHPYFLTYAILDRYADIRRRLRPPYGPGLIGDIDTLIAATALEYRLTLVTTDGDFERVPGLDLIRVAV